MKKLFTVILCSIPGIVLAGSLSYSTGPYKNKDLLKNPAHFGYDEICFNGDPMKARAILYKFMSDDIEYESPFAVYKRADRMIVYGYTHTKCTDEMANDPADCRSVMTAKSCQ